MNFMGEEILKQEYIILRDKMNVIKKNLIELEDIYEDLIINIKDGFMIKDSIDNRYFDELFGKESKRVSFCAYLRTIDGK